jgi:endonuclease YncB( thermonuclease family)
MDINAAQRKRATEIVHSGSAFAEEIVASRPWASVPELRRIRGIGASRLYDIRTVGNACVDGTSKRVPRGPIRVLDGDTVVIGSEPVRFLGMDSPEQNQPCVADGVEWPCGMAATAALEAMIDGHGVECRAPDRGRYRRWLAVCWRDDGLELNAEMVRLGWALAYRPGDDSFPRPEYEPQEAGARMAGRGMWRGTFTAPREWRHR